MTRILKAMAKRGVGRVSKVIRREWRPGAYKGSYRVALHLDCGHIAVVREGQAFRDEKLCRLCKPKKG